MEQWRKNLYLSWISQTLALAGIGFILPFIPLYIQELGVEGPDTIKLWVGLTASIPGIAMALMAPIWGIISDRFGRKIMIVRALSSVVIISVALSFAQSVVTVFILRMLQGLFTGTATASATLVASGTPQKHLSRALGFLSSATFIGLCIGPLIGGFSAKLFGYRYSFLVGASLVAIGLVFVIIFLKEPDQFQSEEKTGSKKIQKKEQLKIRHLLKSPFVAMFIIMFLVRFARSQPTAFIPLYLKELHPVIGTGGNDAAITGLIMALFAAVGASAGFSFARLGDRYDKYVLIIICSVLGSIIAFPTFISLNIWIFAIFYIISGYSFGCIYPLIQSFLSSNSARTQRGILFGLQNLVGGLGFGLGPFTATWISIKSDTRHIFLFYSISIACIAITLAFDHFTRKQIQNSKKIT